MVLKFSDHALDPADEGQQKLQKIHAVARNNNETTFGHIASLFFSSEPMKLDTGFNMFQPFIECFPCLVYDDPN